MMSAEMFDGLWDNVNAANEGNPISAVKQFFKSAEHGVVQFNDKAAWSSLPAKASDIEIISGPKTWDLKRAIAKDINAHMGN